MFNRTFLNMLETLKDHQKADWKSHVPVWIMPITPLVMKEQDAPHYLMFGRHPRLAMDAFLDIKRDSGPNDKSACVVVS